MADYKKLQNGSDIRGVALEGIEGQHVNLTKDACYDIGRGFALWLIEKTGKKDLRVAVGRDSRLSGPVLCEWICDSMKNQGLHITDFKMASTPAMFMATVTDGYMFDGSVMITASHLPFNRNGFKFFTAGGGLESADIKKILAYAESDGKTVGKILRVGRVCFPKGGKFPVERVCGVVPGITAAVRFIVRYCGTAVCRAGISGEVFFA